MKVAKLKFIGIASILLLNTVGCQSQTSDQAINAQPLTTTPIASESPAPTSNQAQRFYSAKVTTQGFGAIRVGMTVEEASQAAGTQLVALDGKAPDVSQSCSYVKLPDAPDGLEFMLNSNRIVRVDLTSQITKEINNRPQLVDVTQEIRTISTLSGARIGDTEAQIKSLYAGKLEITDHKYIPGGHFMTVIPKDVEDSNSRLIFETDGNRVIYIRAGQLPEIDWVERCG
ncbi:hypothetical protein [Microcoleus sp. FACHB-672]|uniref:hypothetical protein n=1 Tax=Microcoleus sp. FACHB-672 TaxID=2692825 RepID=UPI0016874232|nr:hypothetical protein [Microcoleus sp. FACHB-672]MBD2043394.1 hypothetical protein [Microcoleus sp. FACHB-672]